MRLQLVSLSLGMLLGLSCSSPPVSPVKKVSLDAAAGDETSGDDASGSQGKPTDESEMDSGIGKVPDPSPPERDDPITDPNPSPDPVKPEPKYSLLFISGGSDKIDVYKVNKSTGATALLKSNSTGGAITTFLAVNPKTNKVFGADERGNQAIMFALDPASGVLSEQDKLPTAGGPAHISVDAAGAQVFVANYGAGVAESYSVTGSKLKAVSKKSPGNKAHAVHLDPSGKNLFVPCLGDGLIAHFTLDVGGSGVMTEAKTKSLSVGTKGPRHMAFHPSGKFAYLMNEYEGSVQALSLSASGLILLGGQIPSTASPVAGNTGAEISVHPNGKFLYSSNRGDDSIAIYSLAENGTITFKKTVKTGGKTPRHFSLDESGSWLTVANQGSDEVTFFEVNKSSGDLMLSTQRLPFKSAQFAQIVDFYE
ncbi:MAG: hypothetical protein EOP10_06385 [Proteobacteria bacterium]|nr:MAG: hypothetical protein EOP10_06385 [Pseudomonadota bacterium]